MGAVHAKSVVKMSFPRTQALIRSITIGIDIR